MFKHLRKTDSRQREEQIMAGLVDESSENQVDGEHHRLSFLMLELLKMQGRKIYPVEESRLNEADDKLDYLLKTQRVHAGIFALDADWHCREHDNFIAFDKKTGDPLLVVRRERHSFFTDPWISYKEQVTDDNANRIAQEGIFVFPDSQETKTWKIILKGLLRDRKELLIYFLLILIPSVLLMVANSFMGQISDIRIGLTDDRNTVLVFIVTLLITAAVGLLSVLANRSSIRLTARAREYVFSTVISRFLALSASGARKLSRQVVNTFLMFINSLDSVLVSLLSAVVYLIYTLGCIAAVIAMHADTQQYTDYLLGFYFAVTLFLLWHARRVTRRRYEAQARLSDSRRELISSMAAIKSSAAEDRFYHRIAVDYGNYMKQRVAEKKLTDWQQFFTQMLSVGLIFLIILELRTKGSQGIRAVDLAGIIAVLSFSVSFLGNLVSALMGLILGLPDISFVGRILAAPREDSIAGGADQRIRGRIEFSHVSFAYHPGQTPILRDVSFTVEPGEYVAITGPSGSGKSTLIRLMLGFETATGGDVLFDDLEIGQHDLQSLRRQMGVVLQQEGLISGSVKMNIAMDENADMDLVTAAAKKAQIHDVIQSWPMGYNSFLSSESALISGGEKQRILLARALMHEPRILILDEATSAMDNITQDQVKRGLDEMGITRIVVAHRLSTIRDCDKIIVLEKGTIREMGKYDELMAANGLFAEMARRNLL